MIVAMVFRNKKIEMAVGGKKSNGDYKKRISMEVKEEFIKNGEIVDPHALGLQILIELKKHKVRASEVTFAIRSNDIVVADMMIPCVPEKIMLQSVKVALEKDFPGVAEKNYVAYKIYDIQDNKFCLTAAIAPKTIVETYYALANAMKCKMNKIDIYAGHVVESIALIKEEKETKQQVFLDIGSDFAQLYHFDHGIIRLSNSFFTQNYLIDSAELDQDVVRKDLMDKMYQNVLAILNMVDEEHLKFIYVNNVDYLSGAEMTYLAEMLLSEKKIGVVSVRKKEEDFDGLLLKTMFTKKRESKKAMNFALELKLDDIRNYTALDAVLGIAAGASVAAFVATGISGGYNYYNNRQLEQVISQHEAFILQNDSVNQLYSDNVNEKEESEYIEKLDRYLTAADYDFGEFWNRLEDIMAQGASSLSRASLSANFSLQLEASTSNYTNVATVISKLEEEGLTSIRLQSLSINRDLNGAFVDVTYVITADFRLTGTGEDQPIPDTVES